MKRLIALILTTLLILPAMSQTDPNGVRYRSVSIDGVRVFYREAGAADKPALLLLHGFPSASHQFRELIPLLQNDFHIFAPDYPAFGQSDMPSRDSFAYTFDHLARIVDAFTDSVGLKRFAMFVFDYGAPIGFRLALWHPERIVGIVSQNGNVYREGLGKKWDSRADYWAHPTPAAREQYKSAFAPATIIGQYTFGTPEGSVSPDGYTLDIAYMSRPEEAEIQSDLIFDYQSNVALYPKFQEYLRTHRPPLLAIWGKNDPSFIPAGAEAFKRDLPDVVVEYVESGHFALETHAPYFAKRMREFLLPLF